MEIQTAYKQKMRAQLNEWNAQAHLWEAKLENAEASVKVQAAEQLHELRGKLQAASEKMKELETSSGDAWDQIKVTADRVWDELKLGVAAAQSKFK